jgi:hypothetical protein
MNAEPRRARRIKAEEGWGGGGEAVGEYNHSTHSFFSHFPSLAAAPLARYDSGSLMKFIILALYASV